jgi:hypothetical protein
MGTHVIAATQSVKVVKRVIQIRSVHKEESVEIKVTNVWTNHYARTTAKNQSSQPSNAIAADGDKTK